MKQRIIMVLLMLGWLATETFADITITAIYTEKGDEVRKTEDFDGEAPLQVRFEAEVTDIDAGWPFSFSLFLLNSVFSTPKSFFSFVLVYELFLSFLFK